MTAGLIHPMTLYHNLIVYPHDPNDLLTLQPPRKKTKACPEKSRPLLTYEKHLVWNMFIAWGVYCFAGGAACVPSVPFSLHL